MATCRTSSDRTADPALPKIAGGPTYVATSVYQHVTSHGSKSTGPSNAMLQASCKLAPHSQETPPSEGRGLTCDVVMTNDILEHYSRKLDGRETAPVSGGVFITKLTGIVY